MPSKKIGYLTPQYFDSQSYVGGGERFPLNLAKGVAESSDGRYEIEIISFAAEPGRRALAPGVTMRLLTASRTSNPMDVVSWELPEAIADVDLVHIHQAYTRCAEVGLLVARQQRKPVCVTDHGGFSSPLIKQLGLLDIVDRVIAYSDFGASLYRTSTPITVIKGGVDAQAFTPSETRIPRDRILYVGRLLPHKGIDRLIQALPIDLPLTVCGRAYHPIYFEHLKCLSQGKQVEFILDADDEQILDLYRRAWVNVLPSVFVDCYGATYEVPELMGFTTLEAMSCGTPAITSRVAALPEFIREGETGFVFDDLEELTSQLIRLATEPGLADRMGRRGRIVVESEYDYRVAGARLVSVYDGILEVESSVEEAA